MDRKLGKLITLALLAASGSAMASNFCAVTASGANCNFPDLQSCYQHLAGVGGQCVANPQVLSPPQPQMQQTPRVVPYVPTFTPFNPAQSFQEGFETGQRQRHAREEHEAKMAVLKAQEEQIRSTGSVPPISATTVYRCRLQDGSSYYIAVPIEGCVKIAGP